MAGYVTEASNIGPSKADGATTNWCCPEAFDCASWMTVKAWGATRRELFRRCCRSSSRLVPWTTWSSRGLCLRSLVPRPQCCRWGAVTISRVCRSVREFPIGSVRCRRTLSRVAVVRLSLMFRAFRASVPCSRFRLLLRTIWSGRRGVAYSRFGCRCQFRGGSYFGCRW